MRDPEMLEYPWWPTGRKATCSYGDAGHDMEFVVNIEGYGYGRDEQMIPSLVDEELAYLLDGMKLENRGSRIEIHPSGRLFTKVSDDEVEAVRVRIHEALETIGLTVVDSLWH